MAINPAQPVILSLETKARALGSVLRMNVASVM
jgi:hypothetical protein